MRDALRSLDAKLSDRFWSKVDATGNCWEWMGRRDQHAYGRIDLNGRPNLAHRIAYELLLGPIPTGLELDHLCRNRACVNPDHLDPVTHRENMLRGFTIMAMNARLQTCRRGHPFVRDQRQRRCSPCTTERQRRYDRQAAALRVQPHGSAGTAPAAPAATQAVSTRPSGATFSGIEAIGPTSAGMGGASS